MRTTMDKAGRLVVPKQLRDQAGLHPGEVEIVVDGAGVRIETVTDDTLEIREGRPVIAASGQTVGDDEVRALRDADQR